MRDKLKSFNKPQIILIITILLSINTLTGYGIYKNIEEKNKFSFYTVADGNVITRQAVQKNKFEFEFTPKTDNLTDIEIIGIDSNLDEVNGSITLHIYDESKLIWNKEYDAQKAKRKGFYKLGIDETLVKDKGYKLDLEFDLEEEIEVQLLDNHLRIKQIFDLKDKTLLKILALTTCGIFVMTGIYFILNSKMELHKAFIIISLIGGGLFIILMPPFLVLDEYRHFNRAYDISQGNYFAQHMIDGTMVAEMPKEFNELRDVQTVINKHEKRYDKYDKGAKLIVDNYVDLYRDQQSGEVDYYSLSATSGYNPIAYFPQIIPIKLASVLKLPPIWILQIARLANLVAWIIFNAMAIKIVPYFKKIFFLIALIPVNLQLAASSSPDAVINALALLFIGYIIYLKDTRKALAMKRFIGITTMLLVVALIKPPYILLVGLVFLLNQEKFLKRSMVCLSAIGVGAIGYIGWSYINGIMTQSLTVSLEQSGSSMGEYIKLVITQPTYFMLLIWNEIQSKLMYTNSYIYQTFARISAGNNSAGTDFQAFAYLMALSIASIKTINNKLFSAMDRIVLVIIPICIYAVIAFTALTWQPVDYGALWGIQGRYFIPFIPLIGLFFTQDADEAKNISNENILLMFFAMWAVLGALQALFLRYWI